MCGGVRFTYEAAAETILADIYTSEQLQQIRVSGVIESLFWHTRPVLPIVTQNGIRLYDWGCRDAIAGFPATGWARAESVQAGKWQHLRPQPVLIPAIAGVEQRVWFHIDHGIQGLLVAHKGIERVYMLTLPSSEQFLDLTGHERMPLLVDQEQFIPLEPVIRQRSLGL